MDRLSYIVAVWPRSEKQMPTLALLDIFRMMRYLYIAGFSETETAELLDTLDTGGFVTLESGLWAWVDRN